jgi:plasmid stabilization system protein ParE
MRIRWTLSAAADLQGIYDYLKEHEPHLARPTVIEISKSARSLKKFPLRGRKGREEGTHELLLRRLPHIIAYRLKGDAIEILHIWHAAQGQVRAFNWGFGQIRARICSKVVTTEMSQEQRVIPLILNNHHRQAVATGNNAAWHCECGRALPLVGRTGALAGPSEAVIVECPDCSRQYFVVPRDKDQGAAIEVREITATKTAETKGTRPQSIKCFPGHQRSFIKVSEAPHIVSAYENGLTPLVFQKYARMITLATAA